MKPGVRELTVSGTDMETLAFPSYVPNGYFLYSFVPISIRNPEQTWKPLHFLSIKRLR
jgi:hypothetical protein